MKFQLKTITLISFLSMATFSFGFSQDNKAPSDSLNSYVEIFQSIENDLRRAYYNNHITFFHYMAEKNPVGTSSYQFFYDFHNHHMYAKQIVNDLKFLKVFASVNQFDENSKNALNELISSKIEDYETIIKVTDRRISNLREEEVRSYTLSNYEMQNEFMPAITSIFINLNLLKNNLEKLTLFLEENSGQLFSL